MKRYDIDYDGVAFEEPNGPYVKYEDVKDLLGALKYVVKYHRDNDSGEGELFGLDYVTACIAAINKAEGGKS